ncbi:MAG: CPBP family intramembrane glutamic endopeptidase [Flammeovirgaceae bacterium]
MRKIYAYLYQYLYEEFELRIYAGLAALLFLGIYIRYAIGYDTYFTNEDYRPLKGLLFYCIPYFGTILLISIFKKEWHFFKKTRFWLLSAAILFVLVINQYGLIYDSFLKTLNPLTYSFTSKLGFNLFTAFIYVLIPLIYYVFEQQKGAWYGLTLKGFDYRPYLMMLVFMFPLLLWASYRPDFLSVYPRYVPTLAEYYWNVSPILTVAGYELSYVLQFICLELFFRGFMVMSLEKYLKASAILPMVCVYAFIHFGKPMPETLGSIFGGFILGVIALRTRSIFGGACIHIGIALMMELLAWVQMK